MNETLSEPSPADLEAVVGPKYTQTGEMGPGPRLRLRFGYYNPDDVYEAVVEKLVTPDTAWMDVGCGRMLFPSNAPLARELAGRCARLAGVDPDATLEENPYVHERLRGFVSDCPGQDEFHLATLRMVAEHVEHPDDLAADLARLVRPGGHVVIYTVNRFSPVPLVTGAVPFSLHHPLKRVLWRTERKDTFPTFFRMNTRRALRDLFARHGFAESLFMRLDDCRTFAGFTPLQICELVTWRALKAIGLHYPELCLLGVYRRGEE